jgi:hypothetical protein
MLSTSWPSQEEAVMAPMERVFCAAGPRPGILQVSNWSPASAPALTVPFAFLGPAYDAKLKKVYTSISSEDIFKLKSPFSMLQTDSIGLTDPLAKLVTEYVDEQMLKDIAAEQAKGRRLYIGTTALDAQRAVIWNMGAIAASGHPKALGLFLFRNILIASAAVPLVFPPVYFEVEADGKLYDEMHVDGSVINQVFLYGAVLKPLKNLKELGIDKIRRNFRVDVIRNTQIKPNWEVVKPMVRAIAPRSGRPSLRRKVSAISTASLP